MLKFRGFDQKILALAFFLLLSGVLATPAQTSAFTYQGRLSDAGGPANGSYEMQFALFGSAAGNDQIGPTLVFDGLGGNPPAVTVAGGIFTVTLDFGASPFTGADRFLAISVKKAAETVYTPLNPRQQITSSPYAIRTLSAVSADNAVALENNLATAGTFNASSNPVDWSKLKNAPAGLATFNQNNFIQNSTTLQTGANFNIGGNGTLLGRLRVGAATLPQNFPTAVYGQITGNVGNGVWGRATGTQAAGVYGEGMSTNSFGVYGFTDQTDGAGVIGQTSGGSSYGVFGYHLSSGTGVFGLNNSTISAAVLGSNLGVAGTGVAGVGNNLLNPLLYSSGSGVSAYATNVGVFSLATAAAGHGILTGGSGVTAPLAPGTGSGISATALTNAVAAYATAPLANGNWAGYFDYVPTSNGFMYVAGRFNNIDYGFITQGVKSGMIAGPNDENRIIYAIEAPEILIQDFGTAELRDGRAQVALDPLLANALAIGDKHPLRVFIQLEGDCNGVYVTNKTARGFEVVELAGGRSNVKFSWQIVANRADQIDRTGTRFDADGRPLVSLLQDARLPVGPGRLPSGAVETVRYNNAAATTAFRPPLRR